MLRGAIFMMMPRRPPLKRRRGKHDERHGAVIVPSYGGFGRRTKALRPLRRRSVSPVPRRVEGGTAATGVNSSSERINLRRQRLLSQDGPFALKSERDFKPTAHR